MTDATRVCDVLAETLYTSGLTTVFGVIGDANLFVVDSFVRTMGGTYVSAAHEAGAVLMASGFAQTSGSVGVATVTHGPALTNTVTALVDAVRSRTPLVLLAGDTAVADRDNLQRIDQLPVVAATGAGFEQLRTAETARIDLTRAIRRAVEERRPIVLNMPADLQWAHVAAAPGPVQSPWYEHQPVAPNPEALDRAVGIIASANRPIVLAGRGAAAPGGRAAAIDLAERIGAPLATTLRAKDLFRGEAFDLGVFGTLSTPPAVEAIMESDCLVVLGASLNSFTTATGSYVAGRAVVQCDRDAAQIGRTTAVDAAVVGDVALTCRMIGEWLDEAGVAPSGFRSSRLAERLAASTVDGARRPGAPSTVDIRDALDAVEQAVPADRTVAFDAGQFVFQAMTRLHAPDPRAWVLTLHYGSIGLGMATAIGASYGRPGHPVLLVSGDGGFMLGGLAEFSTAVRHGVDLIAVILNDSSYGAEHRRFRERGMDPSLSTIAWPDLAPVADALGGRGVTVRTAADLERLGAVLADRDRPVLIDVKLDPFGVPGPGH